MEAPNGEKGISMPTAIIRNVSPVTCHDAILWKNGILRVRIMCTISVCDSNPSINHPDWNRVWCSTDWQPNTYHITK